jgi:hypothetical protein
MTQNNIIDLSWTEVTQAVKYRVFFHFAPGVDQAAPFFDTTGLTNAFDCKGSTSMPVYFIVYPMNAAGVLGNVSNEAKAICPPLDPPTIFSAIQGPPGTDRIELSWIASNSAAQYELVSQWYPPPDGCFGSPIPLPDFVSGKQLLGSPTTGTAVNFSCIPTWSDCYAFGLRARNGALVSTTVTAPPFILDCPSPLYGSEWSDWNAPPATSGNNDSTARAQNTWFTFVPEAKGTFNAAASWLGDVDYFMFNSGTANKITFSLAWTSGGDLLNIQVTNIAGGILQSSNTGTINSEGPLVFAPPAANTSYLLSVVHTGLTAVYPASYVISLSAQ